MINTKCFGWDPERQRCKALSTLLCKKGICSFTKPKGTECKKCLYEFKQNHPACKTCPHKRNKVVINNA